MDVHPRASVLSRVAGPARSRATVPHLTVVIVNYHHWGDTAALVRRLKASECLRDGRAEVVVVDNHSPPHPIVSRLRRLRGVSLRRWRRNCGFARAVNEGCRLGQGEWLLLLNPDMTLPPGFLDQALARAEGLVAEDPGAGIIGFSLRHDDGSPQLSTGPFPTLAGTLLRLFLPRPRRKYSTPPRPDQPTQVDWATGCCLLIRRACWTDLGGLDPSFFLYYEDVDLCRRARQRGWSVWFDPTLSAVHHRPLHGRAVPPHLRVITRHALLTYARKHWPNWQFQFLARLVRLEAFARQVGGRVQGAPERAGLFAELGRIARQLAHGQPGAAGRRLVRLVWQQEEQRAQPGVVDRHPRPQSA